MSLRKEIAKRQVAFFKEHYGLIQEGDYYRLSDLFQNGPYTAWEHVSHDKKEALASLVTGEGSWPGDVLMQVGCPLPILQGDYQALQFSLKAE